MKSTNQIWNFLASVKLALITICAIAVTSIIGTLIPQKESASFYIEKYGESISRFFHILDIPDMYSSWWFLALLGILSANLIICSIDRFPFAWKQIKADPTTLSAAKLQKMAYTQNYPSNGVKTVEFFKEQLKKKGFTVRDGYLEDGQIIAGQKGAWSRLGVYVVHLSLLVIFVGAIIGHFFGFKASVMLPEHQQTSMVFGQQTRDPLALGFDLRCDFFEIEFYDNGMPKEYRSRLTVIENGNEVLVKDIEVNDPLIYKGITFYQSSYEPYRKFVFTISRPNEAEGQTFITQFQQKTAWEEGNILFGIVNAEVLRDRVTRLKVWFKAGDADPAIFWVNAGEAAPVIQGTESYTVKVKQMYATGLQVAKDPGVWVVYLGFALMMIGMYMAFFMSHQRLWLVISDRGADIPLMVAGTTNKNKPGFEKTFSDITSKMSLSQDA